MIIFLDFDGVLRRLSSSPGRFDVDCIRNFEAAMRTLSSVSIVISSTWRTAVSLSEIRTLFSDDIASLISGKTPELDGSARYERHEEIVRYLRQNELEDAHWIAIDDKPLAFWPN